MSEKDLREWIESREGTIVLCPPEAACASCQELYDAVAAPPDMVGVLRWLRDGAERIPNNTPVDRSWTSAARAIGVHIERTYHIRLIDKPPGWEYADE